MFPFRAGESIWERVGGEMDSLIAAELCWVEDFVNLETSATVSLFDSELQEANEKTIRTAIRDCQSWLWVNISFIDN